MIYKATKSEKDLFKVFSLLESEEEAKKFLRDLLTEAEIREFANRWKVARMLEKKIAYKSIEKETGMSSTTIARIQKWLNNGMNGYTIMLDKVKQINSNTTHHLST